MTEEKNKGQKNKKYDSLVHTNKVFVLSGLSSALIAAKDELDKKNINLEKGDVHKSREGMVGLNVFFVDTKMIVKYHTPVRMDEIDTSKFQSEIEDNIDDVVTLLKKHYKEITGEAVGLSKEGDVDITLEAGSLTNAWVVCRQLYKIDSISD